MGRLRVLRELYWILMWKVTGSSRYLDLFLSDLFRRKREQVELQRSLMYPLARMSLTDYYRIIPMVFVPRCDPTLLDRVYVEGSGELYRLHFVFSDEVIPWGREADEAYREWRCEEFGRRGDVESVTVVVNPDGYVADFSGTYSDGNLYDTSVHFSGRKQYGGKIYFNTWNHLMSTNASLSVLMRCGRYRRVDFDVFVGGRDDAERYAGSVYGC